MYHMQALIIMLAFAVGTVEAEETKSMTGPEILAPFKQGLQQALRNGLTQGPEEAITVCKLKAPEISGTLSLNSVRLGRTSKRLRNPSNIAPDWVAPILESYVNKPSDRKPRAVSVSNNQSGYVEPIIIQPICLTCHGDNLTPEVSSRITEVYPEDRAVGYQIGDLRGVFWAEFPN